MVISELIGALSRIIQTSGNLEILVQDNKEYGPTHPTMSELSIVSFDGKEKYLLIK